MKRFILCLFLFALPLAAQVNNPSVRYVGSAPSGSCSQAPPVQVLNSSGTIYTCDNGTWAVQGGGGSGTFVPYATNGVIYSANSWTSLAAFTANGAMPSVSAGTLVFTGGIGDYTHSLDLSYYTLLPVWRITCTYTVATPGAATYGLGCGTRSTSPVATFQWSVLALMEAESGGNSGRLNIVTVNNGSASIAVSSSTNLSFSGGDSIQIYLERNYEKVTATVQDLTTGALVDAAYTFPTNSGSPSMPNAGRFAIYNIGGTQTLTSFSVTTGMPKGIDVATVADSKGAYLASVMGTTWPVLLQNYYRVADLFGSGDESADLVNEVAEILAIAPKVVVLEVPGNDVRLSVPIATTKANVASVVSSLQAAGIKVYVTTYPQENSGVDFTALNAWVVSTYPTNYIDLVNNFVDNAVPTDWVLNPAGIHPYDPYHAWIAQTIATRLQNDGIAQQPPYYVIP